MAKLLIPKMHVLACRSSERGHYKGEASQVTCSQMVVFTGDLQPDGSIQMLLLYT